MDEKPVAAVVNRHTLALCRRRQRWRVRDWIVYGVLILTTLVLAYLHVAAPPPSISCDSYELITAGMTEREVERIVGTRPGGYGEFSGPDAELSQKWSAPLRWSDWGNDYGILSVGYDADGRVCYKSLEYHPRSVPEHPELWPWWKRLAHRSIPSPQPYAIYIHF
jgi:hypothetical protein